MRARVSRRGSSSTESGRARAAFLIATGAVAFGGLLTAIAYAVTPAFAATASLTPALHYIGDSTGSVYTFTVNNTGASANIGAVEIDRPTGWTVSSCPTPPAGWTGTASSVKCRFRSAATTSDDIKPGQSKTFNVKAKSDAGTTDRVGTWPVIVSKSNQFDTPSLLKNATATGPGLTQTLYTFEVTDAVVRNAASTPGGACPAANKTAILGTTKTIVVCGKNHATANLTPVSSRSTLAGTYIGTVGTFVSGPIVHNSGNVVLGQWTNTTIVGTYGTGYKVITRIGSASNRTSPLRTFTGYTADSQPPNAVDDAYTTDEDTQLAKTALTGLLLNDSDPEGDPISITAHTEPAHGDLTLNADGSFTYDPDPDYNGGDSFGYTLSDTHTTDTATVTLTVTAVNDAPDAVDDGPSVSEDSTGDTVDVLGNDTDVDADTLTVTGVDTTGTSGTVTNNGTDVTYDPNGAFESLAAGETDTDTFTYTIADGNGGTDTATVTVTITGVNDAPSAVDDDYSTDEASGIGPLSVLANDTDAEGQTLTIDSIDTTGTKGTVTDNADGTVSYDPNGQFEDLAAGENEDDTFTYDVSDGHGGVSTATVTVTVNGINDAPDAVNDTPTVSEDSAGDTVDVLANDTDAESQTLTVTGVDTTGTTGTVTNNGTDVTYDPNGQFEYLGDGDTGSDSFTYTISDGHGGTDTATVNVSVTGHNDDPDAVDDGYSTDEATAIGPLSVLINDSDDEGAVTIDSVDTTGTKGTVTDNGDGTLTYDPDGKFEALAAGEDEDDTFTYTVVDADGATDTATVKVTVNGINDAPDAVDDTPTVSEDSTGDTVDVLANDTDAESQTLTVTGVDTTGTSGTVTNNGTDVTYDPNGQFESLTTGETDTDSFTYTISDGHGGTDTATVNITIDGASDLPVAVADTGSTDEASTTLLSVLTNDSDAEGPVSISGVDTTGTSGTVTDNNDGTLTYDPNGAFEDLAAGESREDTFTYTIKDSDTNTDTATVKVTVNGINDAPVAVDDPKTVGEDSTGDTVDVLGNDTDAESQTLTVTGVDTTGTTGTVTNNGTDVTYDPNGAFESLDAGETGSDSFTYTISDGHGGTDTATVNVTVNGANDAPHAVDDAYQTVQDIALVETAPGVLGNDTDADTSDSITAGNAGTPDHGDVTLAADGSFTYTPDAGYLGPDSFTYDVTDGTATDTGTVNITVVSPNATPTADDTSASGNEDGGGIAVSLSGDDADGDALTFTVGTASNGLVGTPGSISCSGDPSHCTASVTYTPNANFFGTDTFTYTVNDGTVDSAPATATVTVNSVNDAPSFTKGADQTVLEDAGAQSVSGWATAISAGPANESAQVVTFGASTNNDPLFSSLPAVSSAGVLTYTPAVNANGVATVTVQATDDGGTANGGNNQSPTQQFTITVTAVNDVPSFTKGADQVLFEDGGSQSVSGWATAISKGPSDESAQTLTFTATNDNNALFTTPGQPKVSPTGTLTYTSAPNAVGSTIVTVSLADSGGTANGGVDTSPTQTFTITVNAVNDEPSFTHAGNQTVLEDAGAQSVNGFVTSTSAGPADESAQTVTVSVTGQTNAALFSSLPAISGAGTLTYTPAVDANGSSTVTVHATDNGGTANGGDDTSGDQTFTITVTAVNDEPSFVKGADQTLNEDPGAQSVSGWATSISKGPANESAQTVAFTVTNNLNALFSVQPAVSPTGTLTFTPAANKWGLATVSVFVSDNGGTANGGDDTSATQTFTIMVNAVNDAPVAAAKAFTAQANMKISLGGLLVGATDPNDVNGDATGATFSPSFTLGTITVGAGCTGCTVSNVNTATGAFDFDPPAGGTGPFTVTYTVVDNGFPTPAATSAPQTITFTVNGPVIWFVDANSGVNGTGRLSAPFNVLSSATTAMGVNTNQRIFVQDGNVTGNVTLQTDGWLISDAVTGSTFDSVMGIAPPAGTIARPSINSGAQRTLTGTVTLGTNSNVRGFDLTPTATNKGLVANGKTGLVVNQMSITSTTARAVDLLSSSGVFDLKRVTASGGDRGISLDATNVSTGSFTINGTGTAGTGGVISGATAAGTLADPEGGIFLRNTKNVTLKWMTINNNTANGIYGEDLTTLLLEDTTLAGNGTNENLDHSGIHFANLLGTSSIARIDVGTSREDSMKILNTSGTATITVANSTFHDNDATVGANGLYMDTKNTAAVTFTSTTNTFTNNNTDGLAIFSQGTQKMTATVTGGTYTNNGVGVDVETNGSGGMQFSVNGGTVTGCATCGVPVNLYKGSGATGTGANATAGTFNGMTVTNGNSLLAAGIWVHGEGAGAARIAVTNNNISAVQHRGIDVSFGNTQALTPGGAQTIDVSVTGNTINQSTSGAGTLNSIRADAGTIASPSDIITMCVNIASNTITNTVANDIRVINSYSTTNFRIPGYGGTSTDTAAVAAYLNGLNPPTTDSQATIDAGANGFGGGAACSAP
jgi:VCBS repeat-containing protein